MYTDGQSDYLRACMSVCLPVSLPVCLLSRLHTCPPAWLSIIPCDTALGHQAKLSLLTSKTAALDLFLQEQIPEAVENVGMLPRNSGGPVQPQSTVVAGTGPLSVRDLHNDELFSSPCSAKLGFPQSGTQTITERIKNSLGMARKSCTREFPRCVVYLQPAARQARDQLWPSSTHIPHHRISPFMVSVTSSHDLSCTNTLYQYPGWPLPWYPDWSLQLVPADST